MRLMLICMALLPGTRAPIESTVVYVDAKHSFIVIDKGEKDGVGANFDYEVVRKNGNQTETIGSASFEKFLGQNAMAKLKVEEGIIGKIKIDDQVLCRRKG